MIRNIVKTSFIFLLLMLFFIGIGCIDQNSETGTDAGSITIKGSDTVLPLAQAEAEDFMTGGSRTSVTVVGGGSGVGIAALIDGETDIAMASRDIKESEIENAKKNNIDPILTVIAKDGIVVVVHPENPVTQLTFGQLEGIYNGTITNWKDVGGENRTIVVITRDSSSGTYEYFKEKILGGSAYRTDALTQSSTGAIVQEISKNKAAIGYIGFAYLNGSTIKALSVDDGSGFVSPTIENVMNGKYPLSRPLNFYTNGAPSGNVKEFIDFALSPQGQRIASETGYIPIA